jgi:hypothetical protein
MAHGETHAASDTADTRIHASPINRAPEALHHGSIANQPHEVSP